MAESSDVVRHTRAELDQMLMDGQDQTNWSRVDSLTDQELEALIDKTEEGEVDWNMADFVVRSQ